MRPEQILGRMLDKAKMTMASDKADFQSLLDWNGFPLALKYHLQLKWGRHREKTKEMADGKLNAFF